MASTQEFTTEMLRLTRDYGVALTRDAEPLRHQSYLDLAADAGHPLPSNSTLGRIAAINVELASGDLDIQITMLNESFSMMPDYGHGNVCGNVAVTLNNLTISKERVVTTQQALGLEAVVHSSGVVEVAYLEGLSREPDAEGLLDYLQLTDMTKVASARFELDFHQDRTLNPAQLSSLSNLVTRHFRA